MNDGTTRAEATICAVLTDVDGTLVTKDKVLTERALGAVRALRERGILITITSGRPPFGLRMLVEPLGLSQPTVSHHLKVLTDAGLLERERRGTWMFYRLVPDRVEALRQALALPGDRPAARRSA